ncbi:AraC family transcriptional regulator [Clostridium tertium]
MDSLREMNWAMKYIEDNLMEAIEFNKLSQIVGCSEYHFRRMFSFLSGMSLNEYVRLRRLTVAATLLQDKDNKVIDISLNLGYESPDSFTKAFKSFHGITPSQARKSNSSLKAFPPMTFQFKIQGGIEMNYRIVEKEAFKIVGIKKRITLIYEGVNSQMDSMWGSLSVEDFKDLKNLSNVEPSGIICVSANFDDERLEGTELDQYIGVATNNHTDNRWSVLNVEAATWAVFTVVGNFPNSLQDTWARVYSEWFPTSGYESTGGPEILWNEGPDTSKKDFKSEIWIPVVKSKSNS